MAPCPSCGRPIGPKSRRCMYCGAAVGETAAAPAPKAPPSDAIRTSCPKCGVSLKVASSAAGKKLKCSKCGAAVVVPAAAGAAEPVADGLPFKPTDGLEAAYQKTSAWLKAKGAPVYEPELINSRIHSREFGRLLLLASEDEPGVVYVCVAPWDDEKAALVATDLVNAYKTAVNSGPQPSFLILSAHPVPEPIKFLFGNSPAAGLELLLRSGFDLAQLARPEQMAKLATKVGVDLLQKLTEQTIDPGNLETIEVIQELVLGMLRPEKDREKPIPEEAYHPEMLLLTFGALFGEVLTRTVAPGKWVSNEMFPFAIALDLRHPKTGSSMVANPIGKVMKLYRNGQEDDLRFFTKVLHDKLSKPPER